GPVFGEDADLLFLTADALEQAGRPPLAARRAARLLAGGTGPVADLGCAAGTDTVALARAGAEVVAVDRDPLARALTAANAEALGVAARVRVVDGDAVTLVAGAAAGQVAGCPVATMDPARRAGGRRLMDPARWSPPWWSGPPPPIPGRHRAAQWAPGCTSRIPPSSAPGWSPSSPPTSARRWSTRPSPT